MTSIRKALALAALASAAGLIDTHPALAAGLGRAATTQPTPTAPVVAAPVVTTPVVTQTVTPSPIVNLLMLGSTPTTMITPASSQGVALGRPPVSQAIPGPVINN